MSFILILCVARVSGGVWSFPMEKSYVMGFSLFPRFISSTTQRAMLMQIRFYRVFILWMSEILMVWSRMQILDMNDFYFVFNSI